MSAREASMEPRMTAPTTMQTWTLRGLQALVLIVPLGLGGRASWAMAMGAPLVLVLLALTLRERARCEAPPATPGLGALAALVGFALATTVPLPPAVIAALAPETARLYADTLPGWPGGGGWSTWRSLAIDPYGVWVELSRFSLGLGAFAVLTAFPWRDVDGDADAARGRVVGRMLLTLLAGGLVVALLGFVGEIAGNGQVLWLSDAAQAEGRASGPFVNPNHFATWLELVLPLGVAFFLAVLGRVRRSISRAAESGRRMGVRARRAWAAALIAQQRRLLAPLLALAAVLAMLAAHVASGSRGGTAALLVGLAVAGVGLAVRRERGGARWLPIAFAVVLAVAGVGTLGLWASSDVDGPAAADVDVSLASRLAVMEAGAGIVRDHPLVGTGLGSWLHAFRPYQLPPVDGGIWDHAHNDYLELLAEIGIAGIVLVLLFVLVAGRAMRGGAQRSGAARPSAFEASDWEAALGDLPALRWGLTGGVAAVLIHATVDFGLRMPANLLLLMTIVGLLVLTGRRGARAGGGAALAVLTVGFVVAALPQAGNAVRTAFGGTPSSPTDALAAADLLYAEEGDGARPAALALVHAALDRSPADREAHELQATILEPGPEADAALHRALRLAPHAPELHDRLALELWERGERDAAGAALEESMRRFPYLVSHAYLAEDVQPAVDRPDALIRTLAEGDTMTVRLGALDADQTAAIARGLRRALGETPPGEARLAIADDLATVLEARGEWADAAALLHDEATHQLDGASRLARAASAALHADRRDDAEAALLAALVRSPERGDLYRRLAVDVYAARGDFERAERVLAAGERNAVDMTPVYHGVTEVLARRETAWVARFVDADRDETELQ